MRFIRNSGILPLFVLVAGITGIGCSGPHPVPKAVIAVTLSTAPPNSLQAGASAVIAATVTNDSANKGVTWSCAPANVCGSFNPTATASGANTTYTAPATVPAGGSVTLTATSVSDTTKTAPATVTITAPPAIAVAFSMAPPASINTAAMAMITATVTNDAANKGVTWSCVPTGACGTFAPTQTASGTATTYTAPADTSGGTLIIITATSVSDMTKSASGTVGLATTGNISVVINQFPKQQSIQTGASAVLAATVSNDASNKGVNWSCSIASAAACGTFTPTQTASGVTTTYTAPATLPQNPQVTITATSVADNTKSFSITLTIFAPGTQNGRLNGRYTFSLNGQVASQNLPTVGNVILDGNGNVTGGEFDQPGLGGPSTNFTALPVTGTYTVGADGRGNMTLSFSLNGLPGNEIALNFALTSNSHAVLVQTDGLISASGSLDLQSAGPFSLSQITGGYSFAVAGQDLTNANAVVAGGIVTADGAGNLTSGTIDTNDGGALSSSAFTGTYTAPDSFGRGTITASNGDTFAYYLVTPKVLRVVETDANFTTGGSIYGQGSAASFSNASLNGKFAFGALGQSPNAGTAVAGQFTADGNGHVTAGIADFATADGATVATAVSLANSTYSFSNSPRGSFTVVGGTTVFNVYLTDPAINLLDPNNAQGGGGALIIENDATAFTAGLAIPQANPATATFSGNYVVNMTALQNQALGVDFELDLSGQATASGGNSYSGLADYAGTAFNSATSNSLLAPAVTGSSMAGTLTPDAGNAGRFTGTLMITPPAGTTYFVGNPVTTTLGLSYYQVSSTQVLFIQIDGGEVALGVLEQ